METTSSSSVVPTQGLSYYPERLINIINIIHMSIIMNYMFDLTIPFFI